MQRSASASGRIEVVQHFCEEDSEALNLVIEAFEHRHGGVSVENTGVHISQLRLHVKNRVLQQDPPDVWVEWPGANIEPSLSTAVADVTDLWTETGMDAQFVAEAKRNARFDGRYRCVPIDIYRVNNVFYNAGYLEEAGVDPTRPSSPSAFLEMLDALDEALDVAPLILFGRDPFGACQFWESLLVAHGGPRAHRDVTAGDAADHRDAVRAALETLDAALAYTPEDMEFLTSADADGRFARREGAIHVNGLWALGRMAGVEGFEYGPDWGHVPLPGTGDTFLLSMNALVPSSQSADDEGVREFLAFAGSVEGLATFDAAVGGVPPRADVPVEDFHPLIREQQRALDRADTQLSSMTHGLGISPEKLVGFKSAVATYLRDRDVDAGTEALVEALS